MAEAEAASEATAQLEGIQADIRAALLAAQEARGSHPVLQDSLTKVTTLLESLVSLAASQAHKAHKIAEQDWLKGVLGAGAVKGTCVWTRSIWQGQSAAPWALCAEARRG